MTEQNNTWSEILTELEEAANSAQAMANESNDTSRRDFMLGKALGYEMAEQIIKEKFGLEE